jgi:hypothetical protein
MAHNLILDLTGRGGTAISVTARSKTANFIIWIPAFQVIIPSVVVEWTRLRLEVLATDLEVRVRFPVLTDFLRSSGSEMGSIQPREFN